MDKLQRATDYLTRNVALRQALGIHKDTPLKPHFLGQGEHNDNFVFEDPPTHAHYVLRVNRASQPFHANQIAYEFAALKAVKPSGCTPEPLYLDDTRSLIDADILVTDFCEGDELNFDDLQTDDLNRVACIMANIHAVPVPHDCPLFRPANPLLTLFNECRQRFDTYLNSAFEDTRITAWVKRFIAASEPATYRAVSPEDCTHIINTETLPSHFLLPHGNKKAQAAGEGTTNENNGAQPPTQTPNQALAQTPDQTTTQTPNQALAQTPVQTTTQTPNQPSAQPPTQPPAKTPDQTTTLTPNQPPDQTPNHTPTQPPGLFVDWERQRHRESSARGDQPPGFFVDWERPIIGEVAQDIAYFTSPTTSFWDSEYLFTSAKREAFIEQYWDSVGNRFDRGSFDERFGAWLMMTALRSTTWCCKALIAYHTNPETLTPKAREKLPVYLSDEFMELLTEECFHL